MIVSNPFDHHRPVGDTRLLDREAERAQLHEWITSGRNILVYGPRRRGKTSLLLAVLDETPRIALYADATRKPHASDLGAALLAGLAATGLGKSKRFRRWLADQAASLAVDVRLGADGVTFAFRRTRTTTDPGDTGPLLDALELLETVAEAHDVRFTVCIDEFQVAMGHPGLVAGMRSVAQHQKRVNYLLSGSEETVLRSLNQESTSPFYKQLTEMHLTGLTIDHVRNEAQDILEARIDDQTVAYLRSCTEDNTMRLVQVLRHLHDLGAGASHDAARVAVAAAVAENSTEYERLLSLVKPGNQRDVLFALAQDRPEHPTSASFIQKHRLGTPAYVQRATAALRRLQILGDTNRFLDPLLPVYLTS